MVGGIYFMLFTYYSQLVLILGHQEKSYRNKFFLKG